MKRLVFIVAIAGLACTAGRAFGQTPIKLGHLDTNELISSMPETDSASVILERSAQELVPCIILPENDGRPAGCKIEHERSLGNRIADQVTYGPAFAV